MADDGADDAADDGAGAAGPGTGLRRRRVRKKKNVAIATYTRNAAINRRLGMAMLILLAIYAAVGAAATIGGALAYGGIAPGMGPADVRYVLGPPTRTPSAGDWVYDDASARIEVIFAGDHVATVACDSPGTGVSRCPLVFNIGVGLSARELFDRLGPADRETLADRTRELAYDGIGYRFALRQGAIVRIGHGPRQSRLSLVREIGWRLLP